MDTDVWILGGYQSDFARNLTKEGLDFADLTREIVDATLATAKIDAGDIDVVHVANAFGEMFAEQGHLGAMPATVADEYDRRHGLDETHLRAIAQLNFGNARRNPNAQTRQWTVPDPIADDDGSNPRIEGRLRRFDCSQMTDGGAGVVLVTDKYLRDHPDARPVARIAGWGHRTVGLGLQQKLDRAATGDATPYVMPHVRAAALDALR